MRTSSATKPAAQHRGHAYFRRSLVLAGFLTLIACDNRTESVAPYAPGLGEIMTFTQMRHAKLWIAGEAQNWELADYETDELEEGFHDAIVFHPTHKDSPATAGANSPCHG